MKLRTLLGAGTSTALALALTVVISPAAHAAPVTTTAPGSFNPVESHRLVDTRSGLGAPKVAVGAFKTLTFTATTGLDGPVGAVALNVTAVGPSVAGYLTVFAAGTTRPLSSNVNFGKGQVVPNLVITRVNDAGQVSIYNGSAAPINVLADIHGYFVGGANTGEAGTLVPLPPTRFLDTRIGTGAPKGGIAPYGIVKVKVAGVHGVPADAAAVVVNLIGVNSKRQGNLVIYPDSPTPNSSTVNYAANEVRANFAVVQLGPDGTVSIYNNGAGALNEVLDVSGYFVGGNPETRGSFVPSTPFRVFDSRGTGGRPAGALTTSKIRVFEPDEVFSLFSAIAVNVTAVRPQAAGYLTTWDGIGPVPAVSNSNYAPGHNVAGSLFVPVNPDGTISIYNGSYGNVDLVIDVTGFVYDLGATTAPAGRQRAQSAQSSQASIAAALQKMKQFSAHPAATPVSVTR